jgi:cytochrome P450
MRAFRRSPMDFLDVLVDSGAGTTPVRMGPERVLLVDDAAQVWDLLTKQARRTGKGRGLVRARLLLGEGLLTSEGEKHLRHRPSCSRLSTRSKSPATWPNSPTPHGEPPTGGPTVERSTLSQRCRP